MADPVRSTPPGGLRAALQRDAAGLIIGADPTITELLGWAPEEVVGSPSTSFIHPQDQPSAISAWMDMVVTPGVDHTWRGRYRTRHGDWVWVQTSNVNQLEDPDVGAVVTEMVRIDAEQSGIEEELRAREQLLSQLSDAVPVGILQFDAARTITFANHQLHTIVGQPGAATVDAAFAGVREADREALEEALEAVLSDRPVDDLEIRVVASDGATVVCSMGLRALTNSRGQVTGAIACLSDITERAQLHRRLERRATIDELTSCMNRRAVIELLTNMIDLPRPPSVGLAVVFADLDGFKSVNDEHGHGCGDAVLVAAAERLRQVVRAVDSVGRLGGDEFLVVCPGVRGVEAAGEIGQRVAGALHHDLLLDVGLVGLRASVGVAYAEELGDPDELIALADTAMYEAKHSARPDAVLRLARA